MTRDELQTHVSLFRYHTPITLTMPHIVALAVATSSLAPICRHARLMPTQLVIPKHHGRTLLDIPDDQLSEILPVAKKLAKASGAENYNILQNNGRLAHQVVDHVHFHMIPKPNEKEGLGIGWPAKDTDMDGLKKLHEQLKSKM